MTELVIFDCDGVLVDSEPIAVRIDVEMLAELGVSMSEAEAIERYVGRSPEVILAETEATLGHRLPDGWFERGEARMRQAYLTELRPVDGINEALEALDLPVCVASSSGHESLRFKLELTGLYERFAGRIFSATEVANGKPAPDLFLHAARRMGMDPSASSSSRTVGTGAGRACSGNGRAGVRRRGDGGPRPGRPEDHSVRGHAHPSAGPAAPAATMITTLGRAQAAVTRIGLGIPKRTGRSAARFPGTDCYARRRSGSQPRHTQP